MRPHRVARSPARLPRTGTRAAEVPCAGADLLPRRLPGDLRELVRSPEILSLSRHRTACPARRPSTGRYPRQPPAPPPISPHLSSSRPRLALALFRGRALIRADRSSVPRNSWPSWPRQGSRLVYRSGSRSSTLSPTAKPDAGAPAQPGAQTRPTCHHLANARRNSAASHIFAGQATYASGR